MMTALLALGQPAVAMLAGAAARAVTRPLLRKAPSAPGMSDLVLLAPREGGWYPSPPGLVTLAILAEAHAFAILPPESEGLPAGAPLAAQPLGPDFCEHMP
jgi:molybdopterin biosynthesis enzyme